MQIDDTWGGKVARKAEGPLWKFTNESNGKFLAPQADYVSRLYFPLFNTQGMKSFVNPELKGDIALNFEHYLTPATVTEELHRNVGGRNFWLRVVGEEPWSLSGNSVFQRKSKWSNEADYSEVEGMPGCFTLRRKHRKWSLQAETKVFVPSNGDQVEIMLVKITNESDRNIRMIPFFANPIFARHPDHFRDHRQVTTMFQEVWVDTHGVRVKPRMVHDEHGHRHNDMQYLIYGFDPEGEAPNAFYPYMLDFIGEGGSLDNPETVYRNLPPQWESKGLPHGKEAIGAFRFDEVELTPGESKTWVILHGISDQEADFDRWIQTYRSHYQSEEILRQTLNFWEDYGNSLRVETNDKSLNGLLPWLNFQLKCRQVYGNSYLPDFGYGRGGRGWRDLWQDLISIFLLDAESAREEMLNNFRGIRIDGSNATIIGTKPGEFIADRNNIPRTWSDHGAWPVYVLQFYLHETGDFNFLLREIPFWKDKHIYRSKRHDEHYQSSHGNWQLDISGKVYQSTVLEHVLIQQLSAFYHVGEHQNVLLEGGDWNDTYDMAREKGESVCFTSFYAANFRRLADMLEVLAQWNKQQSIDLLEEIILLLDLKAPRTEMESVEAKNKRLNSYFNLVSYRVSGQKVSVPIADLVADLRHKYQEISRHLLEHEWVSLSPTEGFFNGHYNNLGRAQHGVQNDGVSMDLTSQVIPILSGIVPDKRIRQILPALDYNLAESHFSGYRLCTPYPKLDLNMGRVSGFIYGYKEHGSKWSQQNIMLMQALYEQGFVEEGYRILQMLIRMGTDSAQSKLFPGIPSFFEPDNRGAYAYLTGSSTWMVLALTTAVFGIQGQWGNLRLVPRLPASWFQDGQGLVMERNFRKLRLSVRYENPDSLDYSSYQLAAVSVNGHKFTPDSGAKDYLLDYGQLEALSPRGYCEIKVLLSKLQSKA